MLTAFYISCTKCLYKNYTKTVPLSSLTSIDTGACCVCCTLLFFIVVIVLVLGKQLDSINFWNLKILLAIISK